MGESSAESLVRARVWMSDYEDADWDENDLARLLDTIREEERERCAYLAETYAPPDDTVPYTPYGACQQVAALIRESKP